MAGPLGGTSTSTAPSPLAADRQMYPVLRLRVPAPCCGSMFLSQRQRPVSGRRKVERQLMLWRAGAHCILCLVEGIDLASKLGDEGPRVCRGAFAVSLEKG